MEPPKKKRKKKMKKNVKSARKIYTSSSDEEICEKMENQEERGVESKESCPLIDADEWIDEIYESHNLKMDENVYTGATYDDKAEKDAPLLSNKAILDILVKNRSHQHNQEGM